MPYCSINYVHFRGPEISLQVARKAAALPYPPHWSEEIDAASGVPTDGRGLKDHIHIRILIWFVHVNMCI